MNRSLESVIEEIAENEEMSKEFMAMDEIDEIYAYCKSMGLGSSEEEFDEEVSSMINNLDIYASELDKNSLNLVAGGSSLNKHFNKVVASALSALVITGAGAANSNIAAGMNMPGKAITASSDRVEKRVDDKKETSKSDVDATSDSRFVKIKKSLEDYYNRGVKYASEHKKGTIATIAAIILVAVYTVFAIHNKDANPLHWFGNRANGGFRGGGDDEDDNFRDRTGEGSTSSLSDEEKRKIDNVVTSLSFDVQDHRLDEGSLQEIKNLQDEFKENEEALSYLSQKLKELGHDPAKVGSGSQVLPGGHMSDTPVSEVHALELSLLVNGINPNARVYELNDSVKFNGTVYDFSANPELKQKVEDNISVIFNSTSDDGQEVRTLTQDSTVSDAYGIFCFSETGCQVPEDSKFNLDSKDPLERQAMTFVTDVWKAQQQRNDVQ